MDAPAIREHTEGSLRLYSEEYTSKKDLIGNKFHSYYIASFNVWRNKDLKLVTTSTWTNFIPTVLPETDYVMLVLFDFDGQKRTSPAKTYLIEQEKLLSKVANQKVVDDSINYFVVESIEDPALKGQILSQTILITDNFLK